jgi:hypothetical protein
VGALALAVAAVALASPQFQQTANIKLSTAKTNKSAGVNANLAATDPGAQPPGNIKPATKVTITLPGGTKTDTTAVKTLCTDAQLNSFTCPAASKIGGGTATANAVAANGTVLASNVQNTVTAFAMKSAVGFIIQGQTLQVTLPLKSQLTKSGKLTTDLTKVPSPIPGGRVVLTSFNVKLNKKSRTVGKGKKKKTKTLVKTPKKCPKAGWKTKAVFEYATTNTDPTTTTATVTTKQKCKAPPKKRRHK